MTTLTFFQQEAHTQQNLFKGFEMVREFKDEHLKDVFSKRTGKLERRSLSTWKLKETLKDFNRVFGTDIDLYELGYRESSNNN